MLCQAVLTQGKEERVELSLVLQLISSYMMQENGLDMEQVQKIASRCIREKDDPSHETIL